MQCRNNPRYFIERFLYIKTKDQRITPLRFNSPQEIIWQKITEARAKGFPGRFIVLKARQEGVSTLSEAYIFSKTILFQNTNSLIVADQTDKSQYIFNMAKLFYDRLPQVFQPKRRFSNKREFVFEDKDSPEESHNSGIRIDTAMNLDAGRAMTIHHFHGSEVAFWPDAETLLAGVLQAVPETPNSTIILESTANGVGDYFQHLWQMAKEEENEFEAVFLPWFVLPEYRRLLLEEDKAELETLDDEEKMLIKRFKLWPEQLNWRRYTIRNKFAGNVELFRQEYPADDAEAFIAAGQSIFDKRVLKVMYQKAEAVPYKRGILVGSELHETESGELMVWQKPESGRNYVIACDVAEGLEWGDYSCIEVLCRETREQVAEWHGHIDPILFAHEIEKVARWYNNAVVAIEINNHGLATQAELKRSYFNLYRWQTFDSYGMRQTTKIGWQTNCNTKPLLVDLMIHSTAQGGVRLNSKELLSEMMTFIRDGETGARSAAGCHDDRVMAMMIALQVDRVTFGAVPDNMQEIPPVAKMLEKIRRESEEYEEEPLLASYM